MDDQILIFVFLLVGFILLGVELFVPSGGTIGILSIGSFLASIFFAYRSWSETNPLYWRIYLVTFLLLIPVTLYGLWYLLTRTALGNRVLLVAPSEEEVTPYQKEQHHLQELIGRRGVAVSPLTPGGLVNVSGERLHAIGEGFIIESGQAIEVVGVRGTRVVVRTATSQLATNDQTDSFTQEQETTAAGTRTPAEDLDPFQEDTDIV